MNQAKMRNGEQEEEQKLSKCYLLFTFHFLVLLNKSLDAIEQNVGEVRKHHLLKPLTNPKQVRQMKSINRHNDFSSSNSELPHYWCVRLSSSVLLMVKSPLVETKHN